MLEPEMQMTPFVTDVTSDGLISLGFPEPLTIDSATLSDPGQVAMPSTTSRRLLSKTVSFEDEDGSEVKYEILDTIEIKLSSTEDEDLEAIQVDWMLKSFDGQSAQIQMDLDSIFERNIDMQVYDNVSIQFNDATGAITTQSGKGINFGETISWQLQPLVKKSVTDGVQGLAKLWLTLVIIAITITFFLAIFQGSLVSTWMLINSLQLIAHVPLIANKLPANAHYFLLNFLGVVRLNFELINSQIDSVSEQMSESELLSSADSIYSAHLRSSGYHFSFIRNMLLILSIAVVIGIVWSVTAIFNIVKNKSRSEEQQRRSKASNEAFMNNFMVRFAYEAFFELMICAFISVTNQEVAGLG